MSKIKRMKCIIGGRLLRGKVRRGVGGDGGGTLDTYISLYNIILYYIFIYVEQQ